MRAIKQLVVTAKAPTSQGTFEGSIFYNPPEGDSDGERIANFTNTPGTFPLDYAHLIGMDPGAIIGTIKAAEIGDGMNLAVAGRLALGEKMADAVHERMLLPSDDPMVLQELSISYAYDPTENTKDKNGVIAVHDAELLAISIVHAGAQETKMMNVKSEMGVLSATRAAGLMTLEQALKVAEDLGYPADVAAKMFESVVTDEGEKRAESDDDDVTERMIKALGGKPWHISEQDGKFCVIKDSDNSTVTCHDTRKDALAHVRALYANIPDAGKADSEKANEPTEEQLRHHMGTGHQMSPADGMSYNRMKAMHQSLHAGDAGHAHGDLSGKTEKADGDPDPVGGAAIRKHLTDKHGMSAENTASATDDDVKSMHEDAHLKDGPNHFHSDPGEKAEEVGEKWDGAAAMRSAHSAGDFRKIAFERANDSDPDTAAHWALPHHASPGGPADKGGVSAALTALGGGRGGAPDLKNAGAARSHLEAHRSSFGGAGKAEDEKAGRVIGAKRVSDLKSTIGSAIDEWSAAVNGDLAREEKSEEVEVADADIAELNARLSAILNDEE